MTETGTDRTGQKPVPKDKYVTETGPERQGRDQNKNKKVHKDEDAKETGTDKRP